MKKFVFYFIFCLLFSNVVYAKGMLGISSDINTVISQSGISKNSVSIEVRNVDNGKTLYKQNEFILNHPASVQKLITTPAAMDVLGKDYRYTTELYRRSDSEYVIKLGADPYFSTKKLEDIVGKIDAKTVKKIYIDDSIVETKDWGEGWQWDDELNVCMPKFNAYNLDGNILPITVMPTKRGERPLIINPSKYPIAFINNVVTSDKNNIKIARDSSISENALTLDGTVAASTTIQLPVNNLRRYFDVKLTRALEDRNIYLKTSYERTIVKDSDNMICKISNPIAIALDDIFKDSNNMVTEITMKLASAKKYNKQGTDVLGLKLLNEYCDKLGVDTSRIRLVDASGVSKNNLVDADFVVEYLVKSKDNETLKHMVRPGEGTLEYRMIPLKENLQAKTGTLSNISSIAGYLVSKSGKKYAFCIIINDPKSTNSEKKVLEDYLIRTIYLKG